MKNDDSQTYYQYGLGKATTSRFCLGTRELGEMSSVWRSGASRSVEDVVRCSYGRAEGLGAPASVNRGTIRAPSTPGKKRNVVLPQKIREWTRGRDGRVVAGETTTDATQCDV